MRYFFIASSFATALVAMTAAPAHADKAPWCAFLGGSSDSGTTECLYYSREQCMATVSGFGGFCFDNPNYSAPARPTRTRSRN